MNENNQPQSQQTPSENAPCPQCNGVGWFNLTTMTPCDNCNATGKVPSSESSHSPTEQPGVSSFSEGRFHTKDLFEMILSFKRLEAKGFNPSMQAIIDKVFSAREEFKQILAKQAELIAWLQNKVNECQQDHDHHMAHGCSIERINQITGARNAYQRALEFVLTTTPKP